MEISTSRVSEDLLRGPQTLALFPGPWCLGPTGLALPLGTLGACAGPSFSVHKQAQQRKQQVFQAAVCPRAAASGGKRVLNGEVADTNTQLRNTVGKIHHSAFWGGGSPGVAQTHHSLPLCSFSLGGRGVASSWCYSGLPFHSQYSFSTFFYGLCNGFPRFNSFCFKYLEWLLFSH